MTYKKLAICVTKYNCEKCNYITCKKSDYLKHLQTQKHNLGEILINDKKKVANKTFECICGKIYKHNQSLFNHKKKCVFVKEETNNDLSNNQLTLNSNHISNNIITQETIIKLINESTDIKNLLITQQQQLFDQHKQLIEQQKQLVEIVPKIGNNITNNNTANIKQKFNINIFLNEQCKDAINMNDFIKKIQLTLNNLDFTKHHGLAEGLSNIFIENMNKLSLYERPLHCTDSKRETLYIKDQDGWEKDKSKTKIKDALKSLSNEHYKLIREWMNENPDFKEVDSKQDYFARIIKECGAKFDNISDKLVKKICNNIQLKDDLKDLDNTFLE